MTRANRFLKTISLFVKNSGSGDIISFYAEDLNKDISDLPAGTIIFNKENKNLVIKTTPEDEDITQTVSLFNFLSQNPDTQLFLTNLTVDSTLFSCDNDKIKCDATQY